MYGEHFMSNLHFIVILNKPNISLWTHTHIEKLIISPFKFPSGQLLTVKDKVRLHYSTLGSHRESYRFSDAVASLSNQEVFSNVLC